MITREKEAFAKLKNKRLLAVICLYNPGDDTTTEFYASKMASQLCELRQTMPFIEWCMYVDDSTPESFVEACRPHVTKVVFAPNARQMLRILMFREFADVHYDFIGWISLHHEQCDGYGSYNLRKSLTTLCNDACDMVLPLYQDARLNGKTRVDGCVFFCRPTPNVRSIINQFLERDTYYYGLEEDVMEALSAQFSANRIVSFWTKPTGNMSLSNIVWLQASPSYTGSKTDEKYENHLDVSVVLGTENRFR